MNSSPIYRVRRSRPAHRGRIRKRLVLLIAGTALLVLIGASLGGGLLVTSHASNNGTRGAGDSGNGGYSLTAALITMLDTLLGANPTTVSAGQPSPSATPSTPPSATPI